MRRAHATLGSFLAATALFSLGPRAAVAGDDATAVERLTLDDALSRARQHSARLAQLGALTTAAEAGLRGAKAGRMPQLELTAAYAHNSDVPELAIIAPGPPPSRLTVFPNIPDTWRTRAALTLPLYTGGRVGGSIEAAEQGLSAAGSDRQAGLQDLALETKGAYWSLVSARDSARVLTEAIAAYESHLDDARNRLDLGMAARNEVLAVQVERDRAELARLQAANHAEVAHADLLRLVGLPPGTRVEPVEPLMPPPAGAEEPEALMAEALASRPELAALRARAAAADAQARVAGSGRLPQLSASGGYDYARPNSRILPLEDEWNDTWSLGVNLSWSAFDGGRSSGAAAQGRAQAAALRHQLEDLERRIRLEVTRRLLELSTAREQLRISEASLEAARENVRVLQDRYREGVSPSSDLLDAETAQLRAGLDRTFSAAGIQVAQAGLERAVGRGGEPVPADAEAR